MEPLTTIELETCAWMELLALLNAAETELWLHVNDSEHYRSALLNRDKIRHALHHRYGRLP